MYPFGHGLSYTTFSYDALDPPHPTYHIADLLPAGRANDRQSAVSLTVNVTNTGSVVSDAVVLAFVSSNATVAAVSPPLKELFDYTRVHSLGPGQSQVVVFGLSYRVLSAVDADGHAWLVPGRYQLRVQNEDELVTEFELVGEAAMVEDFPQSSATPSTNPSHSSADRVSQPAVPSSLPINKHARSHGR